MFASPECSLLFDLNDFDETYRAPFEWDVKRLAASVAVAARGNGHATKGGPPRGPRRDRRVPHEHAQTGRPRELAVWYESASTPTTCCR
ncbi:DUF2252 family protein [Streptomyces sp. KL116D]|uniref:DUF2252 family protein n=1 Tax=Streptomyces sp. KL116D TaxID=3045152 RepID=UPI003557E925